MADKLTFDLVSPEQLLLSTQTEMVTLPGSEGDMGVMAGHAPVITTLRPGIVAAGTSRFVVLGGFAEITRDKVTVLAEEAIPAETNALEARIAAETERLENAGTEAEKVSRQACLDTLQRLRHAV